MGFFDLFRKKNRETPTVGKEASETPGASVESKEAPVVSKKTEVAKDTAKLEIYSGMRVEVTTFSGQLLFVAKLLHLHDTTAELHQYSETALSRNIEPLHVRIRGYNDHEQKAVYMEGMISPLPNQIWKVEDLIIARIGNDRAFFRLATDIDATVTTFGGFNAGENACKLLNISVGGACIRSNFRFHEGDKFLLKVNLLAGRETSAIFCEVLRVSEKGEDGFEYGCRFLELDATDQEQIIQNIFMAQRKKRIAEQ